MKELMNTLGNWSLAAYSIIFTVYFVAMIFKKTIYNISYLNLLINNLASFFKYLFIVDLVFVLLFQLLNPQMYNIVISGDVCNKFTNYLGVFIFIEMIVFIISFVILIYIIYKLILFNDENHTRDEVVKFLKKDPKKISLIPQNDESINYLEVINKVFVEENNLNLNEIISNELSLINYYFMITAIKEVENFNINKHNSAIGILKFGLYSDKIIDANKTILLEVLQEFDNEADKLAIVNVQSDAKFILKKFERDDVKFEDRKFNLILFSKLSIGDIILLMNTKVRISYELSEIIAHTILQRSVIVFEEFLFQMTNNNLLNKNRKFLSLVFDKTTLLDNSDEYFMKIFKVIQMLNKYELAKDNSELIRVSDGDIKRIIGNTQIVLTDKIVKLNDLTIKDDLNSLKLLKSYFQTDSYDFCSYFTELRNYIVSENNFSPILKNKLVMKYSDFSNDLDKKISNLSLDNRFNTSIMPNGMILNGESEIMFKNLDIKKVVDEGIDELISEFKKFVDDNKALVELLMDEQQNINIEYEKQSMIDALKDDNWNALLMTSQWYSSYFESEKFSFTNELIARFAKQFSKFKMKKPFQDLVLNIKIKYIEDYQVLNNSYRTISICANDNYSEYTKIADMLIDLVKGVEYCIEKQIEVKIHNTFTLQRALLFLWSRDKDILTNFKARHCQIGGYPIDRFDVNKFEPQSSGGIEGTSNAYLKLNKTYIDNIINYLAGNKQDVDKEWLCILEQIDTLIESDKKELKKNNKSIN